MSTLFAEPVVSVFALAAQMQACECAAYEREVDASIARAFAQAQDATSRKYSLNEMHAHVFQTIGSVAKGTIHA